MNHTQVLLLASSPSLAKRATPVHAVHWLASERTYLQLPTLPHSLCHHLQFFERRNEGHTAQSKGPPGPAQRPVRFPEQQSIREQTVLLLCI